LSAIVDYQGKKFVFVPEQSQGPVGQEQGSHFQMFEVAVGLSEGGYTEITLPDNLDRSSDIVVQGGYAILSKMKNTEVGDH
jgi:membrane fusion protein, heavy metal efflux system